MHYCVPSFATAEEQGSPDARGACPRNCHPRQPPGNAAGPHPARFRSRRPPFPFRRGSGCTPQPPALGSAASPARASNPIETDRRLRERAAGPVARPLIARFWPPMTAPLSASARPLRLEREPPASRHGGTFAIGHSVPVGIVLIVIDSEKSVRHFVKCESQLRTQALLYSTSE
jgi:hypothetical protein